MNILQKIKSLQKKASAAYRVTNMLDKGTVSYNTVKLELDRTIAEIQTLEQSILDHFHGVY